MQDDDGKVRLAEAVKSHAGCLQAVEQDVMDGKHRCPKHDGPPVQVDQQQRQRDEHTEVELDHPARQVDVQRDEAGLHEGQHQGGSERAPGAGIGEQRDGQENDRNDPSLGGLDEVEAEDDGRQCAEADGREHDAVTQQGLRRK
jgi:hypothetical protein